MLCAVTVAVLPAQSSLPLLQAGGGAAAFIERLDRPWPGDLPHDQFRRAIPARLTGHGVPDVAVLDGTTVVLVSSPDIHGHVGLLPGLGAATIVYDFAALRLGSGALARQGLALVGPSGLRLWRIDQVDSAVHIETTRDSNWIGATMVATHPRDGSVVYGVAADGRRVLKASVVGGRIGSTTVVTVTDTVLGLACIDADADGLADIGVLTASGLTVLYRGAHAPTVNNATQVVAGALQLVRETTASGASLHEWLCYLTNVGGQHLRVVADRVAADVPLGNTAYVALAAGDWTVDGKEELVLSSAGNTEVTVLLNLSGYTNDIFAHNSGVAVRVETSVGPAVRAENHTGLAIADFDGDGDCDLIAPIESSAHYSQLGGAAPYFSYVLPKFHYHLDASGHGSTMTPIVDVVDQDPNNPALPQSVRDLIPAGKFRLEFAVPAFPNASAFEVIAWPRQPGATRIEPEPAFRVLLDQPAAGTSLRRHLDFDRTLLANQGSFAIVLRPVLIENGEVTVVGVADLILLGNDVGADGAPPGVIVSDTPSQRPLPLPPTPEETPPAPLPPSGG